jgi:subtilisin family serine protease
MQGKGTHVYIIDSGINQNHQEFKGRVSNQSIWVKAVAGSPWDCNGHGTHVASTAVGTLAGVAKMATLHSVRVTNCKGQMTNSGVVAAMNWVAKYAQKPAVANMSLGTTTGRYTAYETAARGMVNANVVVVVAAGNDGVLACTRSPGAEPSVLTVGATNSDDSRGHIPSRTYSNYGSCVDLFAPGTDILGATHDNNYNGRYMTGTSMAAPHVTGAAALWRAKYPTRSAKQVESELIAYHTTPNKVTNAGAGSPNRLLYINRAPTAAFNYNCDASNCSFDGSASSDDRALSKYSWDFGDGITMTGSTAVHTYAKAGMYRVTLTVVDNSQQTAAEVRDVVATQETPRPVPSANATTSDDDAKADSFMMEEDNSSLADDGTTSDADAETPNEESGVQSAESSEETVKLYQ